MHTGKKMWSSEYRSGAVGISKDQSPWRLARPSLLGVVHLSSWVEFTMNILLDVIYILIMGLIFTHTIYVYYIYIILYIKQIIIYIHTKIL